MAKKKSGKSTREKECLSSFEDCVERLEAIVEELETGDLALADALARYEEGVGHLKVCYHQLEQAERKIMLLSGVDADGNPLCEPFEDEELESLEAKAAARSSRRSGNSPPRGRATHSADGDVDDGQRLF